MTTRPKPIRRAFTLIEMIAVIGIVVILVGLIFGAYTRIQERARVNRAKVVLNVLKATADEYEVQARGLKIPHAGSGDGITYIRIDWTQPQLKNDPPGTTDTDVIDDTIERFVWAVLRNPDTAKMVRSVGEGLLIDEDGDGFLEVIDTFLQPTKIVYYDSMNDGDTNPLSLPLYPQPFFASAGADGAWDTGDELFSYDVD
jgi:prepilin-type N-terminal cleavage/methylation domain-containing protein